MGSLESHPLPHSPAYQPLAFSSAQIHGTSWQRARPNVKVDICELWVTRERAFAASKMTSVSRRTEAAVLRPQPESDYLPEPTPGELSRRENSLPNSEPTCDETLVRPLDWRRRAPFNARNPRGHPEPSVSRSRQRRLHGEGIPRQPGCGLAWAYTLRGSSYQMPVLWDPGGSGPAPPGTDRLGLSARRALCLMAARFGSRSMETKRHPRTKHASKQASSLWADRV